MYDATNGTIAMLESCMDKIKEHLNTEEVKEAVGKFQMADDVKKMDFFFRKRDKGVIIPNLAPTLYAKLLTTYDKPVKITTGFYTVDPVSGNECNVDPMSLIGKRCRVYGELCIDNIFIGAKPSVQTRLNDVIVSHQFQKVRRLPLATTFNIVAPATSMMAEDDEDMEQQLEQQLEQPQVQQKLQPPVTEPIKRNKVVRRVVS